MFETCLTILVATEEPQSLCYLLLGLKKSKTEQNKIIITLTSLPNLFFSCDVFSKQPFKKKKACYFNKQQIYWCAGNVSEQEHKVTTALWLEHRPTCQHTWILLLAYLDTCWASHWGLYNSKGFNCLRVRILAPGLESKPWARSSVRHLINWVWSR